MGTGLIISIIIWIMSCILIIGNSDIDWAETELWQKITLALIFLIFTPIIIVNNGLELVVRILLGKDNDD